MGSGHGVGNGGGGGVREGGHFWTFTKGPELKDRDG